MNRYQFVKQLGDGTYGSVILATTVETNEKVAIKKMKKKYYSWEECLNLREVKSLRKLNHANIVKLKEVIRENDMLYFVFEFMKENLYQMLKDRDKLYPESTVRNIMYQVLQGLAFMHKHGYFHRDLKPENLLCTGPDCVKVADFGLARETRSRPPYTDYVSTRWYRAPEVLLRSTNYNSPIDIWALGTIMAEVYTLRPLFPGSSEIDQLFKVCSVLGTPTKAEWPEGHKLAAAMNFRWPQMVPTPLKQLMPNASADGLAIMRDMMMWAPEKRPTSQQALRHNFFRVGGNLGPAVRTPQTQPPQQTQQQRQTFGQQQPSYQPTQPKMQQPASTMSTVSRQSPMDFAKPAPKPMANVNSIPRQVAAPVQAPTQDNKNDIFGLSSAKKTGGGAGRRRWNINMGDSMDDWLDDFDYNVSKKPTMAAAPSQPAAPLGPIKATKPLNQVVKKKDDFDDDDFFSSNFGNKPAALPKIGGGMGSNARINSGRSSASSAKQLYMSKSRYVPGKSPAKNQLGSAKRNSPGMNWNNYNKPSNFGQANNRTHNPLAPLNTNNGPNYVPSFSNNVGAQKNNTNYRAGGWKQAQPSPLTFNKPAGGRQPNTRTDWASKYLKS